MRNYTFIFFFLTSYLYCDAQALYTKSYNVDNYYNFFDVDPNGAATVCGVKYSGESSVIKIDPSGNVAYAKKFPGRQHTCRPLGLNNGFSLVGMANSFSYNTSQFIMLDNNGESVWSKEYAAVDEYMPIDEIIQTSDNGYLIASGGYIYFKTDSAGNILWSRKYGENGWIDKSFLSLTEISTGYLISRLYDDDEVYNLEFISTDFKGEILWINNQYLQESVIYHVDMAEAGEEIYACTSFDWWDDNQLESLGGRLYKIDFNGNILTTKEFQVPGVSNSEGVTYDCRYKGDGNFLVSILGLVAYPEPDNAIIFNIDTSGFISGAKVYADSAILQLDLDGAGNMYFLLGYNDYIQSENFTVARVSQTGESNCNVDEAAFALGNTNPFSADVSPWSPDTIMLEVSDIFPEMESFEVIATDQCINTGVKEPDEGDKLWIFPNPADKYLQLILPTGWQKMKYELYDITGKKILNDELNGEVPLQMLATDDYPEGIYFLHGTDHEHTRSEVLIIQH